MTMVSTLDMIGTTEACRLAGISYRQADHWCRIGLLAPDVRAFGSGSRHGYTKRQVQALWALGQLAHTIGIQRVGPEVAEALYRTPTWGGWLAIFDGHAEVIALDLDLCDLVAGAPGPVVVLDLTPCPVT